ncbi:MAG: PAS domain-containing protein [Deltaproteobacteria bacterium]|nr:PAS domain-containing protein [Deltaproteobacteria bacterium]
MPCRRKTGNDAGNDALNERLGHSLREWTATFDAIDDFVSVHDRTFRIVRANRALARFLGLHPRDLIGRRCYEVLHGRDDPWPECPHVKALEVQKTVSVEIEDPRVGRPLLVTCSPFFDEEGNLSGSVHVARDISAQKEAETERERLIAELQQAMSTVKMLTGILPICAGCKKIRDGQGQWQPIEGYIADHSQAEFTHGICPECRHRLYPEFTR